MPTVTETLIDGWAHCSDARCPGNKQQAVKAVRTITEFSYFELGGDIPGIERSSDLVRFNDVADAQCQHCGEPRLVSDQVRPIYPNVSGIPQDRLLQRDSERVTDLALANARHEAEMAQMREQMAKQTALIERQQRYLEDMVAPKPKRAPAQ